MPIKPGEVTIESRVMDHARGAWAGMRPKWWTATHTPTGFAVTWHECSEAAQWSQRDTAIACLEFMVDDMGAHAVPPVHDGERD